ncbi:helix-turn-helix transcriptional regulator [Thalassomonas viridans]|uniref:Helix-turn-helix transcriptional regulator n=1 Tax=Thalassomonas viridans TaxID=137584 RepID=A0AAE9ZAT8_9GAMM|nr:AraC family transcriptional regulator [Thalassomonas viridans]WDE08912.1 helix-turn-helix transcriptional regulator [Thalassomonas viridans]WDE08959.1 helix-turn-helix transcriptional regulator [Thalassomonas viridans]
MELKKHTIQFNINDIKQLLALNNTDSGLLSLTELAPHKSNWFNGRYDLYLYKHFACVGLRDLFLKETFTTNAILEKTISFEFIFQGGSDMTLGKQSLVNNDMPRLCMASHNRKSNQARHHKNGESYTGVGIWLSPVALSELFFITPADYPDLVVQMLEASINHSLIYPLTANMRSIIDELLNNDFTGQLKNNYIEAKITELLCHTLSAIKAPELAFNQDNSLSIAKANAMKKLLSILDADLHNTPCLGTLATRVGMSKGQLTQTFKSSYGMNISEYLTQKRMFKAQALIKQGKLSILQVALEVGYQNQSSFGRAFKKFFGYTPLKNQAY